MPGFSAEASIRSKNFYNFGVQTNRPFHSNNIEPYLIRQGAGPICGKCPEPTRDCTCEQSCVCCNADERCSCTPGGEAVCTKDSTPRNSALFSTLDVVSTSPGLSAYSQ